MSGRVVCGTRGLMDCRRIDDVDNRVVHVLGGCRGVDDGDARVTYVLGCGIDDMACLLGREMDIWGVDDVDGRLVYILGDMLPCVL